MTTETLSSIGIRPVSVHSNPIIQTSQVMTRILYCILAELCKLNPVFALYVVEPHQLRNISTCIVILWTNVGSSSNRRSIHFFCSYSLKMSQCKYERLQYLAGRWQYCHQKALNAQRRCMHVDTAISETALLIRGIRHADAILVRGNSAFFSSCMKEGVVPGSTLLSKAALHKKQCTFYLRCNCI